MRTKPGLVAGLVITLTGCATSGAPASQAPIDEAALAEFIGEPGPESSGGVIGGIVRTVEGIPIAGAVMVLESSAIEGAQERITTEQGLYKFEELPPGNYVIHVYYADVHVGKTAALADRARVRANFIIDPKP